MEQEVLDTDFVCTAYAACRDAAQTQGAHFYKGQLSHVGRHYDLAVGGRPLRVVVTGQEYAQAVELVKLEHRYEMIHGDSGLGGFSARSAHMRGTTFALRLLLLLRGEISDPGDEWLVPVVGDRFHIFDAFALVNALLCSAIDPATLGGRSTREMQLNCLRHFVASLDILDPTVVVLQGQGIRNWIAPALTQVTVIGPELEEVTIGNIRTLLCTFNDTLSPRWDDGWGNAHQPYLATVVEPALQMARRRALGAGAAPQP